MLDKPNSKGKNRPKNIGRKGIHNLFWAWEGRSDSQRKGKPPKDENSSSLRSKPVKAAGDRIWRKGKVKQPLL